MTQAEAVLGEIRFKSFALTFSGVDFVCQKTCVQTGGLMTRFTDGMSLWNS